MMYAEIILWIGAFILGTVLGSFSGALIHRLHFDKPGFWTGRSECPECKTTLKWWNLFPLFSYAFQRGKCAYCHKKIPFIYFILELVFGVTFLLFVQKFSSSVEVIPLLIAVWGLLVLFFYDYLYFEVDLRIVIPAILLAFVWVFFKEQTYTFYLIGAAIGGGFYAIQYFISGGKWVGAGDIYFGILLGLLLGWPLLLVCLFIAYIIGVIVAIYLMAFKHYGRKSALPMGAFLMPAGIICLYNGNWWLDLYLTWSGLGQFYSF
ncbi:prepilin peptidase [bacterium]|nr:prepilin peptidase [bacterium]NCQ55468.1 prepilin peptidase [Candidatus Parcubacteria bacterium]NCS67830.1 prepilin peptidase [Candidatus Peregrinibacteria bacterium]NCS96356.1 prepilin peptidase [bacterium]